MEKIPGCFLFYRTLQCMHNIVICMQKVLWGLFRKLTHLFISGDFSSKDIVQDLNRLLKLEHGASSAALREI